MFVYLTLAHNLTIIYDPSPNYSPRTVPISKLVLHYTGMETGPEALERLKDVDWQVSSHYLVYEDGTLYRLVNESLKAWHAGGSQWRGSGAINSESVGIEICNPGHVFGYRPFPEVQMNVVMALVDDIINRYKIEPINVIGHSDGMPTIKQDPGELFPWEILEDKGLAIKTPKILIGDPNWSDEFFMTKLNELGYDIEDKSAAVSAFQRRFRRHLIDGIVDSECRKILATIFINNKL